MGTKQIAAVIQAKIKPKEAIYHGAKPSRLKRSRSASTDSVEGPASPPAFYAARPKTMIPLRRARSTRMTMGACLCLVAWNKDVDRYYA